MAFKSAAPGEGGRKGSVHFRYVNTPAGAKWHAHLAGPPQWIQAHTARSGTKPCLSWISDKALSCPRCEVLHPISVIGYVPVYRESDGAPCCVIVHDSAADLLTGLSYPDYVLVSRDHGEADSVCVQRALTRKPFRSALPARQHAADVTDTLLRMWRINELTEWYRARNPSCSAPVPTPAAPAPTEAPAALPPLLDVNRIAGILDARAEKSAERSERERKTAEWLREQKAAELNGHGKKKPRS